MSQPRRNRNETRLPRPVFVTIKLQDVKIQVRFFLPQHKQEHTLYKKKHSEPQIIISSQHIFTHDNLSKFVQKYYTALFNILRIDHFDNFVTFLMNINHNKVHNVFLQIDYVPRANKKSLYDNIYKDSEGTQIIDVKKPQDLFTYLNALEDNSVVENVQQQIIHEPSVVHEIMA